MTETDAIKAALRGPIATNKGERRAAKTRAQALSPLRIALRLAMTPVVALGVTVTIYSFGSPFEREDAVRHLIAMGGCDAAEQVGLRHIQQGAPGYHSKFDPDGNGIACEDPMRAHLEAAAPQPEPLAAKVLRP